MSTAVLEIKEKVEQMTDAERHELAELLEDMRDIAAAERAEADGNFIMHEEYLEMCRKEGTS